MSDFNLDLLFGPAPILLSNENEEHQNVDNGALFSDLFVEEEEDETIMDSSPFGHDELPTALHRSTNLLSSGGGDEGGHQQEEDKTTIAAEPKRDYAPPDSKEECSICKELFEEGNGNLVLECNHHFHLACCTQWYKVKQTCPLCRSPLKVGAFYDTCGTTMSEPEEWTQAKQEVESREAQHQQDGNFLPELLMLIREIRELLLQSQQFTRLLHTFHDHPQHQHQHQQQQQDLHNPQVDQQPADAFPLRGFGGVNDSAIGRETDNNDDENHTPHQQEGVSNNDLNANNASSFGFRSVGTLIFNRLTTFSSRFSEGGRREAFREAPPPAMRPTMFVFRDSYTSRHVHAPHHRLSPMMARPEPIMIMERPMLIRERVRPIRQSFDFELRTPRLWIEESPSPLLPPPEYIERPLSLHSPNEDFDRADQPLATANIPEMTAATTTTTASTMMMGANNEASPKPSPPKMRSLGSKTKIEHIEFDNDSDSHDFFDLDESSNASEITPLLGGGNLAHNNNASRQQRSRSSKRFARETASSSLSDSLFS